MHVILVSNSKPKFEELGEDYNIKDYGVEDLKA